MKISINKHFKLGLILLTFTISSCKKEVTLSEYKFSDKGLVLNCEGMDQKLINEALFAFEDDIIQFYMNGKSNRSEALAYSQFIREGINGNARYNEIITPHTVEIFNVLKGKKDLWNLDGSESLLNYNSSFFTCIANNIQDERLKTTLNALVSTNSMSPKLFGSAFMSKYRAISNDKYLAAYMAFDLFYAKLFNVDLSQVKERAPEKVDFNSIPQQ